MSSTSSWHLLGHTWAISILSRDLASGRLGHAYLFTGPPGIGKRTLAVKFAQAINCTAPGREPGAPPCGECRPCVLLERGVHPDAPLVHSGQPLPNAPRASRPTAESRTLKIEHVRELERQVSLAPYEARYRTPLLLRFHEATIAAQNALLKTLEEPPPQVVLLLTAESADRLLPTIASRCQVINLRPLPPSAVAQALVERWQVEAEQAQLLGSLSGGRLGWAVQVSQDDERLAQRTDRLEELFRLVAAPRRDRLAYAERLSKRGRNEVIETLTLWQSLWRDVMLSAGQAQAAPANIDQTETIQHIAARVGPAQACRAIEAIRRADEAVERNANLRLVLEVLLLDLPRAN